MKKKYFVWALGILQMVCREAASECPSLKISDLKDFVQAKTPGDLNEWSSGLDSKALSIGLKITRPPSDNSGGGGVPLQSHITLQEEGASQCKYEVTFHSEEGGEEKGSITLTKNEG